MRLKGKTDANQTPMVKCFRQLGCSVLILSGVGGGCPDIEVGVNGYNCLVEIKGPDGKLTPQQVKFFSEWKGMKTVLSNVDSAVKLVNFLRLLPPIDFMDGDM